MKTHPLTRVLTNHDLREQYACMAYDSRHAGLARVYAVTTAIMAGLGVLLAAAVIVVVL